MSLELGVVKINKKIRGKESRLSVPLKIFLCLQFLFILSKIQPFSLIFLVSEVCSFPKNP